MGVGCMETLGCGEGLGEGVGRGVVGSGEGRGEGAGVGAPVGLRVAVITLREVPLTDARAESSSSETFKKRKKEVREMKGVIEIIAQTQNNHKSKNMQRLSRQTSRAE